MTSMCHDLDLTLLRAVGGDVMMVALLMFGLAACTPEVSPGDASVDTPGVIAPVTVTTTTFGSRAPPSPVDAGMRAAASVAAVGVDAASVDAARRRRLAREALAAVPVVVVPATHANHPIVVALKGLFNDDTEEHTRALREYVAAPLQARYRAIDSFCAKLFDEMNRTERGAGNEAEIERQNQLWGVCEWRRPTCGNGEAAIEAIVIEREEATTATVEVKRDGRHAARVQFALLDRWRITEVDCGRDIALEASGLLDAGVVDAGSPDPTPVR